MPYINAEGWVTNEYFAKEECQLINKDIYGKDENLRKLYSIDTAFGVSPEEFMFPVTHVIHKASLKDSKVKFAEDKLHKICDRVIDDAKKIIYLRCFVDKQFQVMGFNFHLQKQPVKVVSKFDGKVEKQTLSDDVVNDFILVSDATFHGDNKRLLHNSYDDDGMSTRTVVTIFVWLIVIGVILTLFFTGVMVFTCGISNVLVVFIVIIVVMVLAFLTSGVYSDERILALGVEDAASFFEKVGTANINKMKEISILRFNMSKNLIFEHSGKENNAKFAWVSLEDIVKEMTVEGIKD